MKSRSFVTTLILLLVAALASSGTLAHATTRGRNGRIVFASDLGFGHDLFTVRGNGTGFRQLIQVDGDAVNPEWSPDGRKIAFELDHPSGPPFCSVMLMRADGTHMVDLSAGRNGCEGQPSFTPSGHRIVFARFNDVTNVEAIWIMNLQGTDPHRITTGIGKGVGDPNVSPSGNKLSFTVGNGTEERQALYTSRLDGSHLRKIVPFRFNVASKQDWAPNGRRILFARLAGDSANVATIHPDGTGLRYLTHLHRVGVNALAGSFSPNGWVVIRRENLNKERFRLVKMHPNGSDRRVIRRLPFSPRFIDWGPQR